MSYSEPLSLVRSRSLGSPLVVGGIRSAGDRLSEMVRNLGVDIEFVELDDVGKIKHSEDHSKAKSVELLWCHGRFRPSWVISAVGEFTSLRWIHSDFVGVDGLPIDEFAKKEIIMTNGGDNFARPMAEWVLLGMLASAKHYPRFVRNSDNAIWDTSVGLRELADAKVLLLGLGSVNSLVAQMCKPFGMNVVGWTRSPRTSLADGVKRQISGSRWLDEIEDADYVVTGLPLTDQTEKLINAEVLERAKDGMTLINLSRGGLIDEDALVGALDSGRINYALLDAFEKEPLSVESPLWKRDNVTVLPHHSWSSPRAYENTVHRMESELALWLSGKSLPDALDYRAGY